MKDVLKRNFVIKRIVQLGVTENQEGTSIYKLPYEELKVLLVLAEMNKVDIDHPEHKWFR